jgi:hypothetical protein
LQPHAQRRLKQVHQATRARRLHRIAIVTIRRRKLATPT